MMRVVTCEDEGVMVHDKAQKVHEAVQGPLPRTCVVAFLEKELPLPLMLPALSQQRSGPPSMQAPKPQPARPCTQFF